MNFLKLLFTCLANITDIVYHSFSGGYCVVPYNPSSGGDNSFSSRKRIDKGAIFWGQKFHTKGGGGGVDGLVELPLIESLVSMIFALNTKDSDHALLLPACVVK